MILIRSEGLVESPGVERRFLVAFRFAKDVKGARFAKRKAILLSRSVLEYLIIIGLEFSQLAEFVTW